MRLRDGLKSSRGVQDAVSAQQRSFARAMKKRQVAAGSSSSAKSMSHSAGARLYDQTGDGEESSGPVKSLGNPTISNGVQVHLMQLVFESFYTASVKITITGGSQLLMNAFRCLWQCSHAG